MAVLVIGCASGPSPPRSEGARTGSTSGSERLDRAREEMGLAELVASDEDSDDAENEDRTFVVGNERLPPLPRSVDAGRAPLHDGLERAVAALAIARPEPHPNWDRPTFSRWVEREYAAWLRERGEALRRARQALAAAEQGTLGEYVVASAVIGILFARFAAAIGTIPLPRAIDAHEGERVRYRNAFLRTAAPLWERAIDAFGACASATARATDRTLERWQRFCDEHLEAAQEAPRPVE
jgi:hypothetical protein